jgi:hypothetical protein
MRVDRHSVRPFDVVSLPLPLSGMSPHTLKECLKFSLLYQLETEIAGPGADGLCQNAVKSRVSDWRETAVLGDCLVLSCGMRVATVVCVDVSTPLRFVAAWRLETPAGSLTDALLVSPSNKTLGKLDGVLVNPLQRRVCYYVVKSGRGLRAHRFLLQAAPAALEAHQGIVRIDAEPEDLTELSQIAPRSFPPFSDADLIDAMFAPRP